jgi:hypothetical protein
MEKIFLFVSSLVAAFFGTAAIAYFCDGDLVGFALCGLLCYYSASHLEEAWEESRVI